MSNFDDWRSQFLISISSDDFTKSFDECISYIEQISYFNKLCEPNSDKTDSFLIDTVRPAIDTILKIEITNENRIKLGDITNFLKKVSVLIPLAFMNDKFNLFTILNQITDPETELYNSIKKITKRCENLVEIKKYIIEHEFMTIMLMKLSKGQNIQVSHFAFYFQTFNKLVEYINDFAQGSLVFGLRDPYQLFLDLLLKTRFQDIDTKNLEELFSNFCILASTTDPNMFIECIQKMTILATSFFFSSELEYEKIGSSLLKIFADTKQKQEQEFIFNAFLDTLANNKLIPKILTQKLDPEIYPIISPLIDQICSSKYINAVDVTVMWENVINSDEKESQKLFDIVLKILNQLNISEVENFFQAVPVFSKKIAGIDKNDEKNQQSLNLQTFSKLVVHFLMGKPMLPPIPTQLIFNKLFDTCEEYIRLTSSQPDDFIDLTQLYVLSKDNSKDNNANLAAVRKTLLKVLHSRFNEKYTAFIVRLLTGIASSSSSFRSDFDRNDIKTVTKYITELNNDDDVQYSLYPLYTILINEFDERINSLVLQAMLKSPSDATWDFLYQIIEKSQFKNFDEDAIQMLTNFVLNNYNQDRDLFLDFLELFMINMNIKADIIEKPYDMENLNEQDLKIKKIPLLYEEILDKIIIETEDDKILMHAKDISFNFYKNYPNKSLVTDKLLKLFKEHVIDDNYIKKRMNIVLLLFEYCKSTDSNKLMKEISHSKVFAKCHSGPSKGKLSFSFKLPDDSEVKIKSDTAPTSHMLYRLVLPYLDTSMANYYIHRDQGNPISLKDNILFSKSRSNVFLVKDVPEKDEKYDYEICGAGFFKGYQPTTSEFFILNDVSKSLFECMNHFDSPEKVVDENQQKFDKLIYDFLSYLPTDPTLFQSSCSSDTFFPQRITTFDHQSFVNNKYCLQYMFQVLLIRFNCKKYISNYKEILQQILSRLISTDDEQSLTLCSFMLTEILKLIKILHLNSDEFILFLIKLLSLTSISNNSDNSKLEVIKCLKKLISEESTIIDISNLLCNYNELFNKVLRSISNNIWSEFQKIIFKIDNPGNLFNFISMKLLECHEEEMSSQINRYYTDIFNHFILDIIEKVEDPKDINNCIRILMKIMRCNPTNKVIESLEKIVNKNSSLLTAQDNDCSLTSIVEGLIRIVRVDSKPTIMDRVIELLILFAKINIKNERQLIEFAGQIADYNIEYSQWNLLSESDQQNDNNNDNNSDDEDEGDFVISNKEKGLKNFGQNCFLNSALQQFYHIPAFRYFISTYKGNNNNDGDDNELPIQPSLNLLFYKMEYSRKNFISPEEFYEIFISKHQSFEPHTQQDALEFIQYFLDDIKGDAYKLFEWKLQTKYNKLEDGQEISSRIETNVSLPLSVKSGSMEDSLREFFSPQKLTGDNLYQLSNGMKMESIVTQKIETAPPVLIFQLARFSFDKERKHRIKINTKFTILDKIDIKKYMLNSNDNESYKYILNGIVVHRGDGQHGHYISLIKENINSDNWLKYDDTSIDRIKKREDFENLAFGDENDNNSLYGSSGYLLFYVRENATISITVKNKDKSGTHEIKKSILDHSFPINVSDKEETDVKNDNNHFLFNQCVLEKSTFTFMMKCSENLQLFSYFFGVFCHTKLNDKIKEIQSKLISSCNDSNNCNSYLELLINEDKFKSLILPVFTGASPDKMNNAAFFIISTIVTSSKDKKKAGQCITNFIHCLKNFNKKWNRICDVGELINNYLSSSKVECCKFAQQNKWEKLLLEYVFSIYESTSIAKVINISSIFKSLSIIITSNDNRDAGNIPLYLKLPSINSKVKDSDIDMNKENYKDLIIDCISSQIFTVDDITHELGNDFNRTSVILHRQLNKIKNSPELFPSLFEQLTSVQGFSAFDIISEIEQSRELTKKLLTTNLQLIIHILILEHPLNPRDDMNALKKLADMITKTGGYGQTKIIFDDDEKLFLFNDLKELIPSLEVAYPPFFTVLNWLIQSLKIDQKEKIEGLDELLEKSKINFNSNDDNADLYEIESFFHPDMLTKSLSELLQKAAKNKDPSINNRILSSFENSIQKPFVFAQICSLSQWKDVLRSNDFTFASNVGSILVKMIDELDALKNDEIFKISLINSMAYLFSLVVQSNDYRIGKFIPNLKTLVDEVFKFAKKIINFGKGSEDEKSEVEILIEPDFNVILDFESYLKIIEKLLEESRRNDDKDMAMANYSTYIIDLISISERFTDKISDSDTDKLKQIQKFIKNALYSKISIKPGLIFRPSLDGEKDDFIFYVIDLSYIISNLNGNVMNEMNYFMKNNMEPEIISLLSLFKLKFNIKVYNDMSPENCAKDIAQLCSRVKKHRELFFYILTGILANSNNDDLKKAVVKSMFLNNTQMTEKSFLSSGMRIDSGSAVRERNFYENFLKLLSDDEYDEVLQNIKSKYSHVLACPKKEDQYELMQATTRLMILLIIKPEKKRSIVDLVINKKDEYPDRIAQMASMIINYNES